MAAIGSITATGSSQGRYDFKLYTLDTEFKALGGVYILLRDKDPIYVGQTGDLSNRFENHHKEAEIRRHRADRIGVLVESREERRLAIERDLLANYSWPANG